MLAVSPRNGSDLNLLEYPWPTGLSVNLNRANPGGLPAESVSLLSKLTHEVNNTSLDPLPNSVTVDVPSRVPSNNLCTHVLSRYLGSLIYLLSHVSHVLSGMP